MIIPTEKEILLVRPILSKVGNKTDLILISLKINLFSSWYNWKIAELTINNNHSLTHNSPRVDMSLHSDTLFWFRSNQSLLFLLNAVCLAEKQQIPNL
jgi:hypothetical protein